MDLLAARLGERRIDIVADAAYASSAWRGLPGRVTATFRLRADAALFGHTPPRTGKRGRPAKWGARLRRPEQIARDPATAWHEASVKRYGKTETLVLCQVDCL